MLLLKLLILSLLVYPGATSPLLVNLRLAGAELAIQIIEGFGISVGILAPLPLRHRVSAHDCVVGTLLGWDDSIIVHALPLLLVRARLIILIGVALHV